MSKRNQKTRQNHHHQIVFFPCLVVFSVVMVGFVCLFLSLLPPSPNHFGIATKAEAPAKKTDRDSNNSNENEIINKKNKRLLSRRQAPQVCGFSCKRTTAHVKHVQGGRNVQTKPKSYDNGFCGILVSLFFFHIIRWLFSMIVLLLFLLVICLLFGLVVGSCFLFLFFFVLGTCGWEWVWLFYESSLASSLGSESSDKICLISSGDLPLINVAIFAQPKWSNDGKSM